MKNCAEKDTVLQQHKNSCNQEWNCAGNISGSGYKQCIMDKGSTKCTKGAHQVQRGLPALQNSVAGFPGLELWGLKNSFGGLLEWSSWQNSTQCKRGISERKVDPAQAEVLGTELASSVANGGTSIRNLIG